MVFLFCVNSEQEGSKIGRKKSVPESFLSLFRHAFFHALFFFFISDFLFFHVIQAPLQCDHFVTQLGGHFEVEFGGSGFHLFLYLADQFFQFFAAHGLRVFFHLFFCLCHFFRNADEIADGFFDGGRSDAVFFVVGFLQGTAALRLVDREAHGIGHHIGVHDNMALAVSRGTADGLDQGGFGTQKTFFIGIQDRYECDFRDVETLTQKVDADEHIEDIETHITDDLGPFQGVDIGVQVAHADAGDQSRKSTLVDYGFRLPSALDNRPLNFEEFESKIDQMLFVSATPNVYENEHELLRVEQIIRPTGLLDPEISVRPVEGQIDDLIGEVNKETKNHHKVLITTLTKRMAEDLTQYMSELGIRVKYLHSDIDTLERAEIIRDLRLDVFDVLVGINLLREGLDIPEITLVAILDADKEGFLRSETSLIQTIGRAARNSEGHVIMYADKITDSMRVAIDETERRRKLQQAYNEEHGITPKTIQKSVRDLIAISKKVAAEEMEFDKDPESMSRRELEKLIGDIQKKMKKAAAELNFEAAAEYRDKMVKLKNMLRDIEE